MARTEIERTARQSVLDRLIDDNPGQGDGPIGLAQSVRLVKAGLKRDMEWLLNTRRTIETGSDEFEELPKSLWYYGIPDITSLSYDGEESRSALVREVEEAIAVFEPRLMNVRVSMVQTPSEVRRRELRFTVEATLRMEPNPEPVVFDTVLELSSGQYEVKGTAGA